MSTQRLEDFDVRFLAGMDSVSEPGMLEPEFYARSMNTVNRGGIVQCRPGYRCKFVMPQGNLQGGVVFRPKQGAEVILFAVEGLLYASTYPFNDFQQVPGVAFTPHARQLFFQQAEQSIQANDDGSLTVITSRNLVVIQDGGLTPPAVFDGTTAEHQRGPGSIPIGGVMKWSGDRLWVSRGSNLFASDIANPLSFTEPQYFATVEAFVLPGEITAMEEVPNAEIAQLLVFTDSNTSLLQSGIRDRTTWNSVPNFQRILLPSVGCVSHRSLTAHLGLLYWFSTFGLTSLDSALLTRQTSVLPYRDNEMADSKAQISPDMSGVATAFFENYLLVSVPFTDRFNRHTWVLDEAPVQRLGGQSQPAWNSFWTGTRPVQWLFGTFNSQNQIFYFSKDYDGNNRMWEAFSPDRLDDGCPITWYVESRGFDGRLPLRDKKFRYADIALTELFGEVDIAVFWAGSSRGKYKKILEKRIRVASGSIRTGHDITADTILFAMKKQMRGVRTQDAREIAFGESQLSVNVESDNAEFIDESFQLLIVGSGPGAIAGLRYYLEPPTGSAGSVSPNKELSGEVEDSEIEENFVRYDGAATEDDAFEDALATLAIGTTKFVANTSATVTQSGFTAVATGSGESVISQANADRIALTTAIKKAVAELQRVLPKIVSLGLAANP